VYASRFRDFCKAVVYACGLTPSAGSDSDARQVLGGTSVEEFHEYMGSLREGQCLRAHLRCERLLEKHSVPACGKTPSADGDSELQQVIDRVSVEELNHPW